MSPDWTWLLVGIVIGYILSKLLAGSSPNLHSVTPYGRDS